MDIKKYNSADEFKTIQTTKTMGKMSMLIDELIEKKSNGNALQASNIKMKLIFKGVYPDKISAETPDSDEIISRIREVARDFNITLKN